MTQYFGKYPGNVIKNVDAYNQGRLQVNVPSVTGDVNVWAMPCVPFAGEGVGFFALPSIGANVWVEFQGGNPDYPIWVGCFWGRGHAPVVPSLSDMSDMKVIKTDVGSITLNDSPEHEGITIETKSGMKIALTALGLEITNGKGAKIQLTGSQVSVNDGALEVI
jgi:uncharacterized protein involved in type VI secretion and phage assembly